MTNQEDQFDKRAHRKVDFHANEAHTKEEFDKDHDGKIADPQERHKDKLLDAYCDTHPSSPECRVYDD